MHDEQNEFIRNTVFEPRLAFSAHITEIVLRMTK